jgi:TonB family protein
MTAWENLFYVEMPGPGAPIYVIGYDEGIPRLLLQGTSRGDSEVKETDHGLDLQFGKFSTGGGPPWHPAHYHFEVNEEGMLLPKGARGSGHTSSNVPMTLPSAKPPGEVPVPIKVMSIEYPRLAAAARMTGTVLLRVHVDKAGIVSGVHAISGPNLLVYAALDNIKLWRFVPAGARGPAVETEFEWQYVFELKGEADNAHWSSEMAYEYPNKVTVTSKALLLQPEGAARTEPTRP